MDGQTAVVTGASRGIGAAVARAFGDAGAHVVGCARNKDALADVMGDVRERGGTATGVRADIRDEWDVEQLMDTAAREGGTIDVVVANAGVYHGDPGETPLQEESYSAVDDHLRTNVRGVFATVREALPHLAEDARVLVSSGEVAREARPGYGSYGVSKAAAEALAHGFAADLAQAVCIVDPGVVATELTDGQGRDPGSVAGQFEWAATEAAAAEVDGQVVDLKTWRAATR
jgi:NAD(P)-dependent dehydrogenase (short-subunit alcohol dehydrogenase family)